MRSIPTDVSLSLKYEGDLPRLAGDLHQSKDSTGGELMLQNAQVNPALCSVRLSVHLAM